MNKINDGDNYLLTKISNGWIIKETIGLKNRTVYKNDIDEVCRFLKGD